MSQFHIHKGSIISRVQYFENATVVIYADSRVKPGSQHNDTDMLRQLAMPESPTHIPTLGETILLLYTLYSFPVTASNIKQ